MMVIVVVMAIVVMMVIVVVMVTVVVMVIVVVMVTVVVRRPPQVSQYMLVVGEVLDPPGRSSLLAVESRDVWLHIENGRLVEQVERRGEQGFPLDLEELDQAQSQGTRSCRGPTGKEPDLSAVGPWGTNQGLGLLVDTVQITHHDDVAKTLEVGQCLELLISHNDAERPSLDVPFQRLMGCPILIGRSCHSDGN
jgi:hypothetical protein